MRVAIRSTLVVLVAACIAPLLAQEQLPPGDTLVDKYIQVTGGKAAYEKIRSELVTGSMTLGAMGIKGKLTVYQAEPALMLTEIDLQGIGKIQEGTDGKVAWSLSAVQGPRLKDGEERAIAIREATMHSDTKWRDYYTKAETIGIENVEGKACYKVVLTPKEGSPETRFYDRATNLLVKSTRTLKTPMGDIDAEIVAGDYRKEGDILVPHAVTQKVTGQEMLMTIDSVQHNATIPPEKFAIPDEVKALMAKGK